MPVDERAVRLALLAAQWQTRAEQAEATLQRVQDLADHWTNWGKPEATELRQALDQGPR